MWCGLFSVFPFLFQDRILNSIFIDGSALRIIHKGYKLAKESFPAHTEFLTKLLAGNIVILGIGIDPSGTFFAEKIVKKGYLFFVLE